MTTPRFDLIFGRNTLKEQGIVLEFWTKEITLEEILLPMRDISKSLTKAQIEKSWTMSNNIYQNMSKTPQSTLEAMKCLM